MKTNINRKISLPAAAAVLVFSLFASALGSSLASAATLARVEVRFDRMKTSTATTGTVCAQPATSSTDVKTYTVTFPTGYTVSTTAANWQTSNISTTNLAWPSGASAWPNATSSTATVSGQTVTWTNGSAQTMNTGTLYCFNWTSTSAVSTASSANPNLSGSVSTVNSSSATIDSGSYNTATIADDQIVVTATVPSTFSFALSANTDTLGTLATGSVTTSPTPRTATVNTNAQNGWQVWARDTQSGLRSTSASYTIPSNCSSGAGSNTTLSAGTAAANLGVTSSQTSGTGTISVATIFDGTATGQGGGLCSTNLQTIATSNGTANGAVLTLKNNAAISSITPAATDYTDTITVIGAGLF